MLTSIPFLHLGAIVLCCAIVPAQRSHSQSMIGVGDGLPQTVSNDLLLSVGESSSHSVELLDPAPASLMGCDTRPSQSFNSPIKELEPVRLSEIFPLFHTDSSLRGIAVEAENDGNYGSLLFIDYDAFMGRPDAGWTNNGIRVGFSFANRLGILTERTGIRSQIGASVGVYDWAGTDYRLQHRDRAETQGFLTYGLYYRPTDGRRLVGGLVQDWSFNDTYGVFGQNPVMSQL